MKITYTHNEMEAAQKLAEKICEGLGGAHQHLTHREMIAQLEQYKFVVVTEEEIVFYVPEETSLQIFETLEEFSDTLVRIAQIIISAVGLFKSAVKNFESTMQHIIR